MVHGTTVVETADQLPTGTAYVFHVAPAEHVESILYEGLAAERGSVKDWDSLNKYLTDVAVEADCKRPINERGSCVFAYPTRDRGAEVSKNLSGYATLAIDTAALSRPVYTASYGAATEVMRELRQGAATMDATTDAYNAAIRYWNSVERYTGGFGQGEILIEGRVPPSAITHVFGDMSQVRDR